ncbi:MAG TPA: PA2778 family cysteine peptidase [Burkholderiaceae bacterium]|nr:PA2778 family cysteine peptidase [Burkholderiaceae bacterium]
MDRRTALGAGLAGALALAGCATQTHRLLSGGAPGLPRRVELVDVPFFPQGERYLCGPETLAAVLHAAGLPATPAQLVPQVYLPGRLGSLQAEMLAATRRQGAVPYVLPQRVEAVLREVAGGTPVLILQNLGLQWAPTWHYAVLVGYDLDQAHVVLRSGPQRRQLMSLRTFEHTWGRSDHWAFVALAPGRLPLTVVETEAVRALVAFERVAPPAVAVRAYEAGLQRWPASLLLQMGLGNALYAAGRKAEAADRFEGTARQHRHAAAWINLGSVALELGQRERAELAAREAVALGGAWAAQARQLQARVQQGRAGPLP